MCYGLAHQKLVPYVLIWAISNSLFAYERLVKSDNCYQSNQSNATSQR